MATHLDTAPVALEPPPGPRRDRRPAVALGLVVVGTVALYALLSLAVHGPRVHPDEERYLIAASSLV